MHIHMVFFTPVNPFKAYVTVCSKIIWITWTGPSTCIGLSVSWHQQFTVIPVRIQICQKVYCYEDIVASCIPLWFSSYRVKSIYKTGKKGLYASLQDWYWKVLIDLHVLRKKRWKNFSWQNVLTNENSLNRAFKVPVLQQVALIYSICINSPKY